MLAAERKENILSLLESKKIVNVKELSLWLQATEATIRRDLDDLQAQNQLRRIHGGAVPMYQSSQRISQDKLSSINIPEKKRIGKAAYSFIEDHDAILLPVSTTVLELARLIAKGEKTALTIISSSFAVIDVLRKRDDLRIIHTGGEFDHTLNGCIGSLTEGMLRNIRVEKCFLGTNGIDPEYGFSCPTFEEAAIAKLMLAASKQRFVLSDQSKFGKVFMGKFAPYSGSVDYLICDAFPESLDPSAYEGNIKIVEAPAN